MSKTISATEAKNKLGSVVDWVLEMQDEVIVANHGIPTVVIISYAEYEQLKKLKEQERRRRAVEELEKLREQISARNKDLTEAEAMEIADQITREAIDSLIRKGKLKFKPE